MRRWKRQKAGYICLVEQHDRLHGCRIKNISIGGACLVGLETSVQQGELLTMTWKGRKARRTGRVVWTDGEQVAVQFLGPPDQEAQHRAQSRRSAKSTRTALAGE
jgi:hypothetical protein